jgi:hypothetical protein
MNEVEEEERRRACSWTCQEWPCRASLCITVYVHVTRNAGREEEEEEEEEERRRVKALMPSIVVYTSPHTSPPIATPVVWVCFCELASVGVCARVGKYSGLTAHKCGNRCNLQVAAS